MICHTDNLLLTPEMSPSIRQKWPKLTREDLLIEPADSEADDEIFRRTRLGLLGAPEEEGAAVTAEAAGVAL